MSTPSHGGTPGAPPEDKDQLWGIKVAGLVILWILLSAAFVEVVDAIHASMADRTATNTLIVSVKTDTEKRILLISKIAAILLAGLIAWTIGMLCKVLPSLLFWRGHGKEHAASGHHKDGSAISRIGWGLLIGLGILWLIGELFMILNISKGMASWKPGIPQTTNMVTTILLTSPVPPPYGLERLDFKTNMTLEVGITNGPIVRLQDQDITWGPDYVTDHFIVMRDGVPINSRGTNAYIGLTNALYTFTTKAAVVDMWVALGGKSNALPRHYYVTNLTATTR